jgi:hypothetical protein
MSRAALAVLASSLALSGCWFSRGAVLALRTDEGRAIAQPDPGETYLVWHDPAGWHLRVRSEAGHRFEGLVVTGGARSVAVVGVEPAAVHAAGDGIAFDIVAGPDAGEAGFDWPGSGCTEFSLYVDGDARPMRVFAGAYGANPSHIPFSLCPGRSPPPD